MREVRVPTLMSDFEHEITRVQVEIWKHGEVFSEIERKLEVSIRGTYTTPDDELVELVYDALEKAGVTLI